MNQVFHDQSQRSFIKVFANKKLLRSELVGNKVFSRYVLVPKINILDTKTALITQIDGKKSTLVSEDFLIQAVIDLLEKTSYSSRFGYIPVHGDLQKQNIFFSKKNELTLIDFEHFRYANFEDELANNFFYSDSNCISIIPVAKYFLRKNKIKVPRIITAVTKYANARKINNLGDTYNKLLQL